LSVHSAGQQVDPRGPRYSAWITAAVLAGVLVTGFWPLLAAQTAVFAVGAFVSFTAAPYSVLYRRLVAPRLGPTDKREDVAPLRFAQGVGFLFGVLGTLGYALGPEPLGVLATAAALVAALLNAAFGYCLGCETYLIIHRVLPVKEKASTAR